MKTSFRLMIVLILSSITIITLFTLHQPFTVTAQIATSSSHSNQNHTKQILSNDNLVIRLLADSLGNRLNKSAAILEVTSMLPQVKNVSDPNSISSVFHGISQNLDSAKRAIAKQLLSNYHDFDIVFFLMPNGDMYVMEPYSQQSHLTKNNYAFRDYYKEAIKTHNTYLGGVIISTATGKKQAVISVPIYSHKNNELVGLWGADISLKAIEKSLQVLNITNNNDNSAMKLRIIFADQNGKKIADSDKTSSNNQNESFASLKSFKNAETGKAGSLLEQFNGTKMLITYQPVKLNSINWVILLMRPFQ
jgi:C4-dicarboxylate-specific signal transduction histidine kinase